MKMNNKGFTLVELMAVLAIIAIIGGITIPNVISLMDNNKRDQMVNDAQRLIALAKNAVANDRDFRTKSTTYKQYTMKVLDPTNSINPDPDGGDYEINESFVKYTKNVGYCVYLLGTEKVITTRVGTKNCVKEEELSRSSVKDR